MHTTGQHPDRLGVGNLLCTAGVWLAGRACQKPAKDREPERESYSSVCKYQGSKQENGGAVSISINTHHAGRRIWQDRSAAQGVYGVMGRCGKQLEGRGGRAKGL